MEVKENIWSSILSKILLLLQDSNFIFVHFFFFIFLWSKSVSTLTGAKVKRDLLPINVDTVGARAFAFHYINFGQ